VISSTGFPDRKRCRPHVFKRFQPIFENWAHHVVSLQVNAPDLAGTVVKIKIGGELLVPAGKPHRFRITEVLFDIGFRT
jgi:hypothetical protein